MLMLWGCSQHRALIERRRSAGQASAASCCYRARHGEPAGNRPLRGLLQDCPSRTSGGESDHQGRARGPGCGERAAQDWPIEMSGGAIASVNRVLRQPLRRRIRGSPEGSQTAQDSENSRTRSAAWPDENHPARGAGAKGNEVPPEKRCPMLRHGQAGHGAAAEFSRVRRLYRRGPRLPPSPRGDNHRPGPTPGGMAPPGVRPGPGAALPGSKAAEVSARARAAALSRRGWSPAPVPSDRRIGVPGCNENDSANCSARHQSADVSDQRPPDVARKGP
jgi:hypothetical protein